MAQAEHYKGLILSCMLRSDAYIVLSMYSSLTSSVAQTAAFTAACKASLSDIDQKVLVEIEKRTKPQFKERNNLAHCLWGHTDEIPDAVLSVPANGFRDFVDQQTTKQAFALSMLVDRKKVLVYRLADLKRSYCAAKKNGTLVSHFSSTLVLLAPQ